MITTVILRYTGFTVRLSADRHAVLHLRDHRHADIRQHRTRSGHGDQQAQQLPNVRPGSDAVVSVIIATVGRFCT